MGVIILGLVVGSIHRFVKELHYDNIVKGHIERKRQMTIERSVTIERGSKLMNLPTQPKQSQPAHRWLRPSVASHEGHRHRHRKHPIRK